MRIRDLAILPLLLATAAFAAEDSALTLNERGYFASPGLDVLVYSNAYSGLFSDSKISGVEIVQHGVRTATNGDVRLHATPEQWDPIPELVERTVDSQNNRITAKLQYPDEHFSFTLQAEADGAALVLSVHLDAPLPRSLEGRAGFNLEFLPSAYFRHAWLMDERSGLFPLHPVGVKEQDAVAPRPLARGHRLVLAPEDPERRIVVTSEEAALQLYDGRAKAQNGWFVVRSLLPAGRTGKVLEWRLDGSRIDGWTRAPVIAHSQAGYLPAQEKRAVIELDPRAAGDAPARLYRVGAEGRAELVLERVPDPWGDYLRYTYRVFDFSAVREPGIYFLEFADQRTAPFRIADDVYDHAWQPTLDVYLPVQMDHVTVNEAYRVWHGASHLDDARQAPVDHVHFDLYAQGPTTDSPYAPGEHIPGLAVGGWYDAGDYDIRTQTQYYVVNTLVNAWEEFGLQRDVTSVDYQRRYVDLHVADGKPDLLQQIEHGVRQLVAQHHAVGHAIPGIVAPDLGQYTHLGDGSTKTDNLVYDPALGDTDADGRASGMPDDRWAFTSRSSALEFGSIAALAAASRALAGYDDALAKEALGIAVRAWEEEQARGPVIFSHGNTTGGPLESEELKAALELLVTTGDERYAVRFRELLPVIEKYFAPHAVLAVRALPYLDDAYRARIRELALAHRRGLDALQEQNPYGVPIADGGWAGNGQVIGVAIANWYLHRAFPDVIRAEDVYRGVDYILGTHPDSNLSFVSGVGARSKEVAYGMNRADFAFIPGGVVPGVLIVRPDLPENKEDWPFLWGENEYVISVAASWIFLANAARELAAAPPEG